MNTRKHKILFVEDDQIDRIAFERFAKKEPFPYEYVITDSVEKTRKILESYQFDAAVLDYALGDGTAFDIFKDLEGTPIIIVTSAGTAEIAVNAMKKGAYDYLIKDSEGNYLKTLPLTVENAITRKQAEEELRKHRDHLEELVKERTTKLQEEIAERKQTEEALKASEEKYRILVENAAEGVLVIQENMIRFVNLRGLEILGRLENEILGCSGLEFIHPEDQQKLREIHARRMRGEPAPHEYEYRILNKEGNVRWLHANTVSIEWAGLPAALVLVTDTTKRKQAEEALRESEEQFRMIAEQSVLGIAIIQENRVKYINKAYANMIGYSINEILSWGPGKMLSTVHPEDRALVAEQVRKKERNEPSYIVHYEYRAIHRNGEIKTISIYSKSIPYKGRYADFVIANDITEHKRVEEELRKHREHLEELVEERTTELQILNENLTWEIHERRQTEKALAEERNLLRTLIDNLPDHIYVKDAESRFQLANWATARTMGVTTPNDLIGKTDFDFYPKEMAEQYYANERAVIESGKPLLNQEEMNMDRETGTSIWYLTSTVPYLDSQGNFVGILGIARDITEHKRMDETLQKAKEAAEAANQAKSRFLANMSHELRTPMNAILGFTQLMERDPTFPDKHKEYLGVISRGGEHLLELINDVLELSKIEAGQSLLNKATFNLYDMLNSLEEMIHIRADKKGLQLSFEWTPDVPQYITADERKLRQILINLLGNAVKFTDEGSVMLRVSYRGKETGRWGDREMGRQGETEIGRGEVLPSIILSPHPPISPTPHLIFEIEDTGLGIAPEEMDTLFDAFTQAQSGHKAQEGTGLGLALSRQFVQLMGGDINVSSQIGQGTTFTFDIQIELAEGSEIQLQQPTRRIIGLEPHQRATDGGPYRILIVDDHVESRRFLRILLEEVGFSVQEAANGKQAIELYKNWQPHLIWMDMRMPVMDGYEATKRIREVESRKSKVKGDNSEFQVSNFKFQTPIIALTSSAFEENRATVLEIGCDDFLRKPFREEGIFEVLHKHLDIRFVYEEEKQSTIDNPFDYAQDRLQSIMNKALTPAALADLPPNVITNLEHAISRSDMELINAIIDEIRHHDATVADALAYLANEFNYDEIFRVIQKAKE
jgi:PAS domain S-box-containing protein